MVRIFNPLPKMYRLMRHQMVRVIENSGLLIHYSALLYKFYFNYPGNIRHYATILRSYYKIFIVFYAIIPHKTGS